MNQLYAAAPVTPTSVIIAVSTGLSAVILLLGVVVGLFKAFPPVLIAWRDMVRDVQATKVMSEENKEKLAEVHVLVNSQHDALVEYQGQLIRLLQAAGIDLPLEDKP